MSLRWDLGFAVVGREKWAEGAVLGLLLLLHLPQLFDPLLRFRGSYVRLIYLCITALEARE